MHLSKRIWFKNLTVIIVTLIIICCPVMALAEVFVNMLWNDHSKTFEVQPLVLEGRGITFNRDYQNAYGEYAGLDPGPPFHVEAAIIASNFYNPDDGTVESWGTITFESGGLGLLSQPFDIFVTRSGSGDGRISGDGGVNFIGTSLDPIKIQGPWYIQSGYRGGSDPRGNGQHSSVWQNTDFTCTFDMTVWNPFPIVFSGSNVTIENCYFHDFSEEFGSFITFNDVHSILPDPVWNATLRNNRFENLHFSDNWRPFSLEYLKQVIIEDNHFKNCEIFDDFDGGSLLLVNDCGIKSIKNNSGSGNTWNIFNLVGVWPAGDAVIKCDDQFSIRSTAIQIPEDSSLTIKPGSIIKFHETGGGFVVEGNLIADSTILTSCLDVYHGAAACVDPPTGPIIYHWFATGGAGIVVDTTGTVTLKNTQILYARGGIRTFSNITLDGCTLKDCTDFGIVIQGAGDNEFHIANTEIMRTAGTASPWSGGIYFDNRSGKEQLLDLDSVDFLNNEMEGIEIFYVGGSPTRIEIDACRIISNHGYGFVFPIDPSLMNLSVTNSLVLGNFNGGIVGTNYSGTGVPMRFENNVIIGNAHEQPYTYPHGINISAGTPQFVGNTVAYNSQFGIGMYQISNIEQCHVANNLIYRNGDYGLAKTDNGAPILANNNFWQNNTDDEIRYRGPDGDLYSVEEVQALGGEFATNLHLDPMFVPEIIGSVDSVDYDERNQVSRLIDADLPFSGLTGRAVCPDTADVNWYYIVSHLQDTLWIIGDITEHASIGDIYRIYDFHLTDASPMIDNGRNTSVTLLYDLEGDARFIDGDENGSINVDIGADEFDPDEGLESPIRVNKPDSTSLCVSYDSVTIKFKVADSITQVDLAYTTSFDPAHPDDNWTVIASSVDASSGEYKWVVPKNITVAECYIKVTSTIHVTLSAMSEPFAIKHLIFTKFNVSGSFVEYVHPDNSWSFANDSATMWPSSVWPHYETDLNPVTGLQYPLEFADIRARDFEFPSWPTFVEAFGVDACYFNYWSGPLYKPSAVHRWASIKRTWRGSCFGLALTNLMAFEDSAAFAARDEIGPFANLNALAINNDRRNLINRYYTYQFGQTSVAHTAEAKKKLTNETLQELIEMFSSRTVSKNDRILTLCDTSTVNNRGCHAVTAYYLDLSNPTDSIWQLLVYDNNLPIDYPTVEINAKTGSWTYAPLGLAGDSLMFLEDPLSGYDSYAELSSEKKVNDPFATGADRIELYVSSADSILLSSAGGSIGYFGDSSFNELIEASPIIPRAGVGEPIGYYLREGNWSCQVMSAADSFVNLTEIGNNNIMSYQRRNALAGETDQVNFSDASIKVLNPDGISRLCALDFVLINTSSEQSLRIDDYNIGAVDSSMVELTSTDGLSIFNFGSESSYNVNLRRVSDSGLFVFSCDSVEIAANCTQILEPEWPEINADSLRVQIDYGIDGTVDEIIYVQNDFVTDVGEPGIGSILPYRFELSQNYPNPFNPVTTIEYSLPRRSKVKIEIYNVLGQKVQTLVECEKSAGTYTVTWDGTNSSGKSVSTGIYLYKFHSGDHIETKKMLLLK